MSEGLLTPEEVARLLKVSKRTLWRMAKHEGFPRPVRYNRKLIRWKASEIVQYVETVTAGA